MAGTEERVVAVIMVGGPTKGTRFRPLSLNVPKPLFPLAGQPMVHHPISACRRVSRRFLHSLLHLLWNRGASVCCCARFV
jgi:NDP-sugar pyrophosphorylase family protein